MRMHACMGLDCQEEGEAFNPSIKNGPQHERPAWQGSADPTAALDADGWMPLLENNTGCMDHAGGADRSLRSVLMPVLCACAPQVQRIQAADEDGSGEHGHAEEAQHDGHVTQALVVAQHAVRLPPQSRQAAGGGTHACVHACGRIARKDAPVPHRGVWLHSQVESALRAAAQMATDSAMRACRPLPTHAHMHTATENDAAVPLQPPIGARSVTASQQAVCALPACLPA